MNQKASLGQTSRSAIVTAALLLAGLAGLTRSAEAQKFAVYLAVPPPVAAAPVGQDNYVYYPAYGFYYNSQRHLYYYRTGNVWNTQRQPPGVTAALLRASPAVNMDFHDSPALHHGEMVKRYPANWQASDDHNQSAKSGGPGDQKK